MKATRAEEENCTVPKGSEDIAAHSDRDLPLRKTTSNGNQGLPAGMLLKVCSREAKMSNDSLRVNNREQVIFSMRLF